MVRIRRPVERAATSGFARDAVLVDRGVAVELGEVDVELAVGLVARVEGEPQETLLVALGDHVRDIEERGRVEDAVLDDADLAALFDDEQPTRAIAGAGHEDRLGEPGHDLLERTTGRAVALEAPSLAGPALVAPALVAPRLRTRPKAAARADEPGEPAACVRHRPMMDVRAVRGKADHRTRR